MDMKEAGGKTSRAGDMEVWLAVTGNARRAHHWFPVTQMSFLAGSLLFGCWLVDLASASQAEGLNFCCDAVLGGRG